MTLLRLTVVDSLGISNVVAMPAALFSFVFTAIDGLIAWPYLFTLWLGTFIAGRYTTQFVQKIPDTYLRRLLICVVFVYIVWLIVRS